MQLAFDERVVGIITELKNAAELLYTGQIQTLPLDICMLLLSRGLGMHVLEWNEQMPRETSTVGSPFFMDITLFLQKVQNAALRIYSSDLFLLPTWENKQNTFELFFLDHFAHLQFFYTLITLYSFHKALK